jgi:hypothetical protein
MKILTSVIPGRAPLAREPGIQKQLLNMHLDSGSRAVARVRNDSGEDRAL